MANVKVNKIILQVNGKEIHLTMDEARELHKILGDLFDTKKETIVIREHDRWHPYWYWYPTYVSGTDTVWENDSNISFGTLTLSNTVSNQ